MRCHVTSLATSIEGFDSVGICSIGCIDLISRTGTNKDKHISDTYGSLLHDDANDYSYSIHRV